MFSLRPIVGTLRSAQWRRVGRKGTVCEPVAIDAATEGGMQRLTHQLDGRPDRFGRFCKGMGIVGVVAALAAPALAAAADPPKRPNIVVILGDDMGFSDMGSFGSEIKTPNLDSLAREGVRFTNFYTHASCSPTRSMLLSGVDTHRNGLGNMDEWTAPNQNGVPGYEGYLNDQVATLPQVSPMSSESKHRAPGPGSKRCDHKLLTKR